MITVQRFNSLTSAWILLRVNVWTTDGRLADSYTIEV